MNPASGRGNAAVRLVPCSRGTSAPGAVVTGAFCTIEGLPFRPHLAFCSASASHSSRRISRGEGCACSAVRRFLPSDSGVRDEDWQDGEARSRLNPMARLAIRRFPTAPSSRCGSDRHRRGHLRMGHRFRQSGLGTECRRGARHPRHRHLHGREGLRGSRAVPKAGRAAGRDHRHRRHPTKATVSPTAAHYARTGADRLIMVEDTGRWFADADGRPARARGTISRIFA